jgi:hypothetical protein
MNPIENEQLCHTTQQCLSYGIGSLSDFPGLLKKIIETKAWAARKVKTGEIFELKGLPELITSSPLRGWGEDPKKVEAVIKDEPEVLEMYREAMKQQGIRADFHDNIMEVGTIEHGTAKSYTLSRLKRESPDLFQQVCDGKLSANAAAIQSGFRKLTATIRIDTVENAVRGLLKRFSTKEIREVLDVCEQNDNG